MRRIFLAKILFFISISTVFAVDIPIYIGENEYGIEQNIFILDEDNTGGITGLQFGRTLAATLQHDGTVFRFNDDVNFQGGQLIDFRIENAASAPTCNSSYQGRMYFNTVGHTIYICNGTTWKGLSTTIYSGNQAGLQVRRAAGVATLTTYTDFSFNIIDVESDDTLLYLNDTLTDRIYATEDGLYEIRLTATFNPPSANGDEVIDARIRKNDTTVLPGSEISVQSYKSGSDIVKGEMYNEFIVELNANDFITLQVQSDTGVATADFTKLVMIRIF